MSCMSRSRVISAALTLTLGCGALAGAAAPSASAAVAKVTIRLVGVDRGGQPVGVNGGTAVYLGSSFYPQGFYADASGLLRLRPGTYAIGGLIPTAAAGDNPASTTIVARTIRVRSNATVRLDARGGQRVQVAPGVHGATLQSLFANVCARTTYGPPEFVQLLNWATGDATTPLYARPYSSPSLMFLYGSSWTGSQGTRYDLAGFSRNGLPAKPTFRVNPSGLAKLAIVARSGDIQGSAGTWLLNSATPCDGPVGFEAGAPNLPLAQPSVVTQYVSAGRWSTQLLQDDGPGATESGLGTTESLAGGHSYRQVFGSAVWGPTTYFPLVTGRSLSFGPQSVIADPTAQGPLCCANASISLYAGRRLLKRMKFTGTDSNGLALRARLPNFGWYSMHVLASREKPEPGGTAPALSRKITLDWHFNLGPISRSAQTGHQVDAPVTLTILSARGLDAANSAAPGGTTAVAFRILRRALLGTAPPAFAVRSMRMEASFDAGKTWRMLKLARHGNYGIATVHDPASGYVSLRSIVIDSHGDKTTETIYEAYRIR